MKYIATLFTLGLINNSGHGMVSAGAEELSKDFKHEKLMPAFGLFLLLFGSLTRIVNSSRFLIRTQHLTRIMIVVFFNFSSFVIIAFCCFYETISAMFWVSLCASLFIGVGSALGESVILGFLKTFPGNAIGYYGSGTGMAGITCSLIWLTLKPLGINDGTIILITSLMAVPYFFSFLWLDTQKKKYPYVPTEDEIRGTHGTVSLSAGPDEDNIVQVAIED